MLPAVESNKAIADSHEKDIVDTAIAAGSINT